MDAVFICGRKLSKEQETKFDTEQACTQKVLYASAVSSIMYSMVSCRPDISYSMSVASRYMANSGKDHWEDANWIMRYIFGTSNVGLRYVGQGEVPVIEGYVDANFAKKLNIRRSTTGYVFKVFGNTISWKATVLVVAALSTIEAEYMAACEDVKEALWLRGLVSERLLKESFNHSL